MNLCIKLFCQRDGGVWVKISTECSACLFLLIRNKEGIGGYLTSCNISRSYPTYSDTWVITTV